jgi:hypothetical protein
MAPPGTRACRSGLLAAAIDVWPATIVVQVAAAYSRPSPAFIHHPARAIPGTPAQLMIIKVNSAQREGVSVVAFWGANQVSNTDRYVANVSP